LIDLVSEKRKNGYTYGIKENGEVWSVDQNNHNYWLGQSFTRIGGPPTLSNASNATCSFQEHGTIFIQR
jgi:hypothetical protein